jgi:hypothetical protein
MYPVEEHSSQRVPGALPLPLSSQLVPIVRLSTKTPKVLMTQKWGILPSDWREYSLTDASSAPRISCSRLFHRDLRICCDRRADWHVVGASLQPAQHECCAPTRSAPTLIIGGPSTLLEQSRELICSQRLKSKAQVIAIKEVA